MFEGNSDIPLTELFEGVPEISRQALHVTKDGYGLVGEGAKETARLVFLRDQALHKGADFDRDVETGIQEQANGLQLGQGLDDEEMVRRQTELVAGDKFQEVLEISPIRSSFKGL